VSAIRAELALGSTYARRIELSLDYPSEDHLLEELLIKKFIFLRTNF
jgi:hypothetical protein